MIEKSLVWPKSYNFVCNKASAIFLKIFNNAATFVFYDLPRTQKATPFSEKLQKVEILRTEILEILKTFKYPRHWDFLVFCTKLSDFANITKSIFLQCTNFKRFRVLSGFNNPAARTVKPDDNPFLVR